MRHRGFIRYVAWLSLFFANWGVEMRSAADSNNDLSGLFNSLKGQVVTIYTKTSDPTNPDLKQVVSAGVGTGVIITKGGRIMTAAHVVHLADYVVVELVNKRRIRARVLASVPWADVAMLQLDELPPTEYVASLGESSEMRIGEQLMVVGTPLGLGHTLSVGHLSARRPANQGLLIKAELLQTDASINPGNSGGPMYNMDGEVIGIVSHILSNSGGFEGLGFAVSIDVAKDLLLERNSFWSGIQYQTLEGPILGALNLDLDFAFLVQSVAMDSVGDRLGLLGGTMRATIGDQELRLGGDVILSLQNIPLDSLENSNKARELVRSLDVGSSVEVTILRLGKTMKLKTKIRAHNRLPFGNF